MSRMIDDEETLKDNGLIEIDGCNVVGCKYTNGLYNGVYGCINLNLNPACCKNPDCYFKQLQRAKVINEKLQLDKKFLNTENWGFKKEISDLHAENEKLKAEVKEIRSWEELKLNKYRKALEEVEKYCNECNLKADYTACEVLKIIDEVLK